MKVQLVSNDSLNKLGLAYGFNKNLVRYVQDRPSRALGKIYGSRLEASLRAAYESGNVHGTIKWIEDYVDIALPAIEDQAKSFIAKCGIHSSQEHSLPANVAPRAESLNLNSYEALPANVHPHNRECNIVSASLLQRGRLQSSTY